MSTDNSAARVRQFDLLVPTVSLLFVVDMDMRVSPHG